MKTQKNSLYQRIRNFKRKLYEEGERRALDLKKIKEETKTDVTKNSV